ncbi:MAG: SAF domain-containing protein [Mycobacteriales bacterium]
MSETSSPARRLSTPSWLDLRLVIGILMVLVAVIVGARVVAGADRSTTVWSLSRPVSAGTVLTRADLGQARVRFYDNASSYLSTAAAPTGKVVTRDLAAGDLLPRSALRSRPAGVLLPLGVASGSYPRSLGAGDRIDVFAASSSATSGGDKEYRLVLIDVTVQSIDAGGTGFASASDNVQILVQVKPEDAGRDVPAIAGKTRLVVQEVGPIRPPTSTAGAPQGSAPQGSASQGSAPQSTAPTQPGRTQPGPVPTGAASTRVSPSQTPPRSTGGPSTGVRTTHPTGGSH